MNAYLKNSRNLKIVLPKDITRDEISSVPNAPQFLISYAEIYVNYQHWSESALMNVDHVVVTVHKSSSNEINFQPAEFIFLD